MLFILRKENWDSRLEGIKICFIAVFLGGIEVKEENLGMHGEIRQIALGFAILTVVKVVILFSLLDVGYRSAYIQDLGYMDFFSDYFTINEIDRGTLIISLSGIHNATTVTFEVKTIGASFGLADIYLVK